MYHYKDISSDVIQRVSDGAYIPKDTNNMDYKLYLAQLAAGQVIMD
jgi:hypothetical protein